MALEDIPGQADAARLLRAALRSGRLPHAHLFVGSAGTGRSAMAGQLAQVLLCSRKQQPDTYCGQCTDCVLFGAGRHPDYHEAGVPEGRQSLTIDVVRDIERAAALKPVRAARRVFVIREAERLTIEAANCFLKTLEEPPGGCCFVLIASSLRRIPETVVSRCQVVRFRNLPPDDLQQRLEAQGMKPEDAHWLARRSWGSPGLAEQFKETGLHLFNRELLERLHAISVADNFRLSDWLDGRARENARSAAESRIALQELLECALLYYRDLALAAAAEGGEAPVCNRAAMDSIKGLAEGVAPDTFLERAELVLDTIENIGSNANRRLALDHLLTKLGRYQGTQN